MRAAYYQQQGPARAVLRVGQLPTPKPGPGEVRVRIVASGVHVGDVNRRRGGHGSTMAYPRVIPHNDGAGTIDAVGPGVDPARLGERVWVMLAQSQHPFGTAAEYSVVPSAHAVALPDEVSWEQGAVVGSPGITGHRALLANGSVEGKTIVVAAPLGCATRTAVAVARRRGAGVVAAARHVSEADAALDAGADHVVVIGGEPSQPLAAERFDRIAGVGLAIYAGPDVDRIAEVDLASYAGPDVELLKAAGTLALYGRDVATGSLLGSPFPSKQIAVRIVSNDDLPERADAEADADAARDLTAALAAGDLRFPIAARYPLERIAEAHDAAQRTGVAGRVVVVVDDAAA
ncbi:MAG TPA: zinc-binding dehydrogenase [Conexibacter sp.]|jgi:NADPH2:quinone reductase